MWQGEVVSVQPRIRLLRSFDERSHSYLSYVLRLRGVLDGEAKEFVVAVGKGAYEKHQFRAGDQIPGKSLPVSDGAFRGSNTVRVVRCDKRRRPRRSGYRRRRKQ